MENGSPSNWLIDSYAAPNGNTAGVDLFTPRYAERVNDQLIFDGSLRLAADWLEASKGIPITVQQYRSLFKNGHVSYPESEVLRIFYDWQDYQQMAESFLAEHAEKEQEAKAELLATFELMREEGLLPEDLFKEVVSYILRYCEVNPAEDEKGKVKRLQRYYFSEAAAPEDQVLLHCSRFLVADYVLKNRPSEDEITTERLVDIALGFNVVNGKSLSSFYGSVKNSHTTITKVEIDEAAEKLGLYDYLHRDIREEHLSRLLADSEEEFYNLRAMKLLGQTASVQYLQGEPLPDFVRRLPDLLLTDELKNHQIKKQKREMSRPSNEECIKHGRRILEIVARETGRTGYVNRDILGKAGLLGLGLSPYQLARPFRFGSLSKYYLEIGAKDATIKGVFNGYGIDDFAAVLYEFGQRLGRKPTEHDINGEAKHNPLFPNTHIMKKRGFTLGDILENAGWPNIKSWDIEDYENYAVRFMVANDGAPPSTRAWDYLSKQKKGPSASIIRYKYEGSFGEFKARVLEKYAEEKEFYEKFLESRQAQNILSLKLDEAFSDFRSERKIKPERPRNLQRTAA